MSDDAIEPPAAPDGRLTVGGYAVGLRPGSFGDKAYWFFKHVTIGPFLWIYNRPFTRGLHHIPDEGPVLLASNHLAVMDSFFLPLVCRRRIAFLAKQEYFTGTGIVGAIQRWFFTTLGQVPLDRGDKDAQRSALITARRLLGQGAALGMYPEGTRSPDARLYRGKTGMARIALDTGTPIVPIAMINTHKVNPVGTWIPRPFRCGVIVGEPIDPRAFAQEHAGEDEYTVARALTDHVMDVLERLGGQERVPDFYATEVKASLQAGKGYPAGSEPGHLPSAPPRV